MNVPGVARSMDLPDVHVQPDLLCFSHLRWNFVTQRPQHLLIRAARDRRVFFWEEPIWHQPGELPLSADGALGQRIDVARQPDGVWVVQPHITWGIDFEVGQRHLLDQFMHEFAIRRFVRWYYTPMALGFSAHLVAEATVYDCMDELTGFIGAPPQLGQREKELFAAADVVFTGGLSLFDAKRRQHDNVHAFPSSVDVAHVATAKSVAITDPADQASLPHPRAGFYGVVDERLDIDLLAQTAQLQPHVQFILIGPVVKIDPATLPSAPNIHFLGSKAYSELPSYLAGWDVALLPFALNDATRFISPTKTPEYLAAGKPVVSTPIRDVVREYGDTGLVQIAGSPEAFASAIDRALAPPGAEWQASVATALAGNSWDATWNAMHREIERVRTRRSTRVVTSVTSTDDALISSSLASIAPKNGDSLSMSFLYRGYRPYDYLVVGAGFAGSVLAERLASQLGKRVLIIDKRDHIAGNAYDHYNEHGILIHKYGPHIFHTNSDNVVEYLSQFTEWRPYEHRVLASVAGQLLPIPINLDTVNRLYSLNLDEAGLKSFLDQRIVRSSDIRTSEDIVKSRVGVELYELFFRNYTRKQWGLDPSELDASVAGRVPVRFDRDDRYFADAFQAMPLKGYTAMFERMLDHPLITVETGTSYDEAVTDHPHARIIYTGPIDEYFGFRFGPLPYRSLEFKHETLDCEVHQSAPVINYPNEHPYTRVTEFKYLTGQQHSKTSIVYEFPREEGDPYYPIPRAENAALYARYLRLTQQDENVTFCGRLATYRYLNMDQVVAQALATFRRIADRDALNSITTDLAAQDRRNPAVSGASASANFVTQ